VKGKAMRCCLPIALAAMLLALGSAAFGGSRALDLASLLPKTGAVAGWRTEGKVETYTRDTLFDYIDGGAELYLGYGFRRAVVADYAGPNKSKITVELYDMGSSYDAFGVFAHEQAPERPPVGQESSFAGGLLTFWKDGLFARLFADPDSEQARAAILKLGKAISASLPTMGRKPPLLKLLPPDGLAPRSVRYLHTDAALNSVLYLPGNPLKLDRTTDVAYGEYPQASGPPAKVVVVQYPTVERARGAFLAVDKLQGGRGELHVTQMFFHETERYRRVGAVTMGRCVGLAANAPDSATARRLVDAVVAGIKKRWAERPADGGLP